MSGKQAKRLRKYVYGDMSLKNRTYFRMSDGSLVSDKLRNTYLKIKKCYNHNKWKGETKDYERN
jgi:hypothetical protein